METCTILYKCESSRTTVLQTNCSQRRCSKSVLKTHILDLKGLTRSGLLLPPLSSHGPSHSSRLATPRMHQALWYLRAFALPFPSTPFRMHSPGHLHGSLPTFSVTLLKCHLLKKDLGWPSGKLQSFSCLSTLGCFIFSSVLLSQNVSLSDILSIVYVCICCILSSSWTEAL